MLTYYTRKESRVQMVATDFWGAHAPSRAGFGASPKQLSLVTDY